jgi:hypothetical protein
MIDLKTKVQKNAGNGSSTKTKWADCDLCSSVEEIAYSPAEAEKAAAIPVLESAPTPASKQEPRLYRVIWRWHFYAGLIVLPVLITASITGEVADRCDLFAGPSDACGGNFHTCNPARRPRHAYLAQGKPPGACRAG